MNPRASTGTYDAGALKSEANEDPFTTSNISSIRRRPHCAPPELIVLDRLMSI